MFLFVGLLDNPGDKLFGLFSGLGQEFEGYHIEHLYSLIELCIDLFEVHQPKDKKAKCRNDNIDIEQYRAQTNSTRDIGLRNLLPRTKHIHQHGYYILLIGNSDLLPDTLIHTYQVLGVDEITRTEFTVNDRLTLSYACGACGACG